ncbi:MAG: beta-1,6-N-acetylglucosaminyltransferase [Rikenellaceae bacterium]|nr:beta-1,6-N-acetylglucosaminyltransferase [Rikenellaceae bacterium]
MRIAYLITAYGQYDHLRRLLKALDAEDVHFFIHVDARSPMPQNVGDFDNVTFTPRRRVWWGGWSHTAAILDLMRAAAGFDYCALISGTDYPVRPDETLRRIVAGGGEFINAAEGFRSDKPEKRLKYYHFDGYDRRRRGLRELFLRGVELLLRPVAHKRRYPFERVYVGTVWSVLSGGCVRHILDYVDTHPEYVAFFRTALAPEEAFFQTIIGNSPYRDDILGNLTWTDWRDGGSGPAEITVEHLPLFAATSANGGPFFARKFGDHSGGVVEMIDRLYRGGSEAG